MSRRLDVVSRKSLYSSARILHRIVLKTLFKMISKIFKCVLTLGSQCLHGESERKVGERINEACRSDRMKITDNTGVKKHKSRDVGSRQLVLLC